MSSTLKAGLWMIGAIASFSCMAVAGREISYAHDTFEIMMYRSLIGLTIVSVILTVGQRWSQVTTRSMGTQVLRNGMHFTGQNLWFFAVSTTPLAMVFALEFTTPLWVIILSPLFLGEHLTKIRALAAAVGFAGILIVARPSPETLSPGVLAAMGCAVFFAMTMIFTKRLTRTESIACIMFWLTFLQTIFGVVTSGYDGDIALPSLATAPWLVVIGLAGLVAHFCVTTALSLAPATVVVPFDFIRLPAITIVGMLLYGENPDIWVGVGGVVIFAAIYLNILAETRKNRVA